MKNLSYAILIGTSLITTLGASCVMAETTDYEASHTVVNEPEKVYVETSGRTYRGKRSDEYCFYNDEHKHIHCYDEDPQVLNDRVVVTENRTYRSTRRRYDPIATGIGVGIAIGLPILVHQAFHDRHHYGNRFKRYSRNHRYSDRSRNRYTNDYRGNRRHSRHH
jgi:hypothetical protein